MEDGLGLNQLMMGCGEMLRRDLKILGLAREVEDVAEGEEDEL